MLIAKAGLKPRTAWVGEGLQPLVDLVCVGNALPQARAGKGFIDLRGSWEILTCSLTHVSCSQVELLVMKALSVGLVKGSIDEVDKRVHMTWVQPRVLDLQQVRQRELGFV